MQITIFAFGSRGDVQPYIPLGTALQQAGYEVTLTVFKLDSAPHSWPFPRMAAVVHHGGAGTVAAGLRAGIPSIIVPFAGDQPVWAQQVEKLKVGPKPIPRRLLTAERLAEAFHLATIDAEMRHRAALLGERIRAEDGIGQAVAIIERYLISQ